MAFVEDVHASQFFAPDSLTCEALLWEDMPTQLHVMSLADGLGLAR